MENKEYFTRVRLDSAGSGTDAWDSGWTDRWTTTTNSEKPVEETRRRVPYLILIERAAVDDPKPVARDSWCGRWRSSRVAALSFSFNTFVIDDSTRWHI